jgi:hypothetical protein
VLLPLDAPAEKKAPTDPPFFTLSCVLDPIDPLWPMVVGGELIVVVNCA